MTVQCATATKSPIACEGIPVQSEELMGREAQEYCRYAIAERKKVEAFWGATWTDPIRIHVSSTYRISRALVPGDLGNRGFMEMPLRRVRDDSSSLLHEIVHIYAPNRNLLLAEGLAIYLQAKLGGNPAFPNFGEDLRRGASRALRGVRSLAALNDVRTPQPLGTVMEEATAYILAGSFVGFLIEQHGLPIVHAMKIKYFQDTDTLYIEFRASDIAETKDLDEDTQVDVDRAGNICAITIEHAKTRADLAHFSFEQVSA